jgi:hypothetical protein
VKLKLIQTPTDEDNNPREMKVANYEEILEQKKNIELSEIFGD